MNVFYFVGHFLLTGRLLRLALPPLASRRTGRSATASSPRPRSRCSIHWRFPTAPPRLAGVGLEDTLRQLSDIDIGSPAASSFSNPVAAVPSLHAGFALGVGIGLVALRALASSGRSIGVLYPIAVVLTTIVTGNHFILDAIAGMLVMGLGFAVAAVIFERDGARLVPATRGGAVR